MTSFEFPINCSGTIVSAAAHCINLHAFENRQPNLVLVTGHAHPWLSLMRERGLKIFCAEEHGVKAPANTKKLLMDSTTLDFLHSLPQPVRVLVFKPAADLETVLRENRFRMLNAPAHIARKLENKLRLKEIANDSDVRTIDSFQIVLNPDEPFPGDMKSGMEYIVQTAKGFSGNRTFRIRSDSDWISVTRLLKKRRCRISPRLPGWTYTCNACIVNARQVVTCVPFQQITVWAPGQPPTPGTLGSRGNIWEPPPPLIRKRIESAMIRLGKTLFKNGFKGVFGADFQVSETDVRLIEINPRLTASLPALTPLQIEGGTMPLLSAHIRTFTSLPVPGFKPTLPSGGQIIVHSDDFGQIPDSMTRSGVYRMDRRPVFLRPGWSPTGLQSGECLVWTPPPSTREPIRIISSDPKIIRNLADEIFSGRRMDHDV